jgi:8-oxo-dGTP pyrophosphatase MutT (NUDIX family)
MVEIIDLVDENDNVIGEEELVQAHINKQRHRGSNVIIFKDKSKKEFLVQRRSENIFSNPLKLCFPGGHLQKGETYLEGAIREIHEELFKKSKETLNLKLLFKLKKETDNDPEFLSIFELIHPGPFNFNKVEVKELLWLKPGEKLEEFTGTSKLTQEELMKRNLI